MAEPGHRPGISSWTPARDAHLLSLRERGETWGYIAKVFGMGIGAVRDHYNVLQRRREAQRREGGR